MRSPLFKILSNNTFYSQTSPTSPFTFGPFNFSIQRRWKKPADTAQTRLEFRTRDLKLDFFTSQLRKLNIALQLFDLMSQRRRPYVSVQIMSRWTNLVGLNVSMGDYIGVYPHVFEVFTHPVRKNVCCSVTRKMMALLEEEKVVMKECELDNVRRIKKLLMMSKEGMLHLHALRLVRRELGLPIDFRESILRKYSDDFKLVDLEVVALVQRDDCLAVANVEHWREKEYREKWYSEFETKYAFPMYFPTGFKIEIGFKDKLKNWQRLSYVKPYDREVKRSRTKAGIERFEKRVVGILHEFLSLTIEKMMNVERLVHFRKDFGIEVNFRELLLKHPGIFYISTKGDTQTVFLREAYSKGALIEPNSLYNVRRKMLDLMLLGRRNTKELKVDKVSIEERRSAATDKSLESTTDGDWVIPLLERSDD
ncbi:protein ROOT PRIMORDIUM DEFECTIVE 1 [Beta vulgaris subsp. vulgaris]|uniref:protein ROOT PRIMORDIUM DEFECTIVE 1 n=1 Tax=Beta vulgaris subsp. vulgaris TaxID=3555 RepID=UPI002036EADB|nr:protein ROOT PRIMORDIUM DEFECTIVE 1 [Beta vulgaris subsp. vulgaris]XP_048499065.1 protein ROOT PRIMORDIUM DEFECTIVE 1 [Beta vulgaris subsp. vulgaris]XP_057250271.1 protein ROOT PRIMORDIUM DEFECTIVE 1 [Beta vulgaris subsp. vulgaris]XP_057250272.1 protein ROOT PRIMORDIUM DEFECTIVE 1 [Beta vulgaris subsp. vulgaris]XP_057250273.1 protein ROOT PRIMORDIUM DEFECTIVE 1 [Beta vulgaris subsp. vulgaris]XP_057250274.1 protein ROOT PRIMORDIUM DEFECTIVE 1 [Beta vulgaris subsp. vulgaris]XP_057250275.1 pr